LDERARGNGTTCKDEERLINRTNTNIVLTGFMGVGKDTVGKVVAQNIGYRFISTDEIVVKRIGMSLSQFIDSKGETDTLRDTGRQKGPYGHLHRRRDSGFQGKL
jgi:predicted kinase